MGWLLLLGAATAMLCQLATLLLPRTASDVDAAFLAGVSQPFQRLPARAVRSIRRAEEGEAEGEAAEGEEAEEEVEPPNEPYMPERRDRGIDLDGDKLDNLDEWYKEAITGPNAKGGPPSGFMRDLVLRSYTGVFNAKNYLEQDRNFTGGWGRPMPEDYDKAFERLKAVAKEGVRIIGKDDGLGWLWLNAGQSPDGIYLYLSKSPPYGERPLALMKQGNEEEFWDNVDWERLFLRLHKWNLWGGKAKKFPYPLAEGYLG